ncbi:DUF2075 domain-containing protein [Mesosutterella sp. AGMB02718]|uniref:DUF2075 domain-containing protein n=1 Tax=Mesosutterella faecium TaxID=2925194 RepID=A0ABT7INV8_9BURK|nr:DNA/RNA helicase domain-containing protein [Mesosutterella sp. AGMB02718]MDL2060067.1 DUF2075 domain-containing protein [Mesosutterella sp. AGMB02718]
MPVVYHNSLGRFRADMRDPHLIPLMLADIFRSGAPLSPEEAQRTRTSEFRSWSNSLGYVEKALAMGALPDDCGVLLEYRLPRTSRRVDVIVTGHDEKGAANFVIIELKQWSSARPLPEDPGLVETRVGGRDRVLTHPSLQASSYERFLRSMCAPVYEGKIRPRACAYLHNDYTDKASLSAPPNDVYVRQAPLFDARDQSRLAGYLKRAVGAGRGRAISWELLNGRLTPSPRLIEEVGRLFSKTKREGFVLIEDQYVAYRRILTQAKLTVERDCEAFEKPEGQRRFARKAIIVEGGPGTGKSVVALTVFAELLRSLSSDSFARNIRFVSPTASYRNALLAVLKGVKPSERFESLRRAGDVNCFFRGATTFFKPESRSDSGPGFDPALIAPDYSVLVVDEAHRLNTRTNMYRGSSMVQDVIRAAAVCVFFLDEEQSLRPVDEGSVERIREVASHYGAEVVGPLRLEAQFRCQGAEGFLNWLSDALQMPRRSGATANEEGWDRSAFDFDVLDDPRELVRWVEDINAKLPAGHSLQKGGVLEGARLLAGYAWDWSPEGVNPDAQVNDVEVHDHEGRVAVSLPWNSRKSSTEWAILDSTRGQVGCVHTCQGLEFDYVGVLIGRDLRYDPVKKEVFADYDSFKDSAGKAGLFGSGCGLKGAEKRRLRSGLVLKYVQRCYRVLLSRGIRGARVYCEDKALSDYLKAKLALARDFSKSRG